MDDWRSRANCIGTDPEAFFSTKHVGLPKAVKRVCGNCEVRQECLDWALRHEQAGYWGGTSEHARQKMRVELRIPYSAPEVGILGHVYG